MRLFLDARQLDAPQTLEKLKSILAGREPADDGERSAAGFRVGR